MIKKLISGGQTGADIGGLVAARNLRIPTGGTISKGFRTLAGPRPEYKQLYNLTEYASWAYPPRTECNVRDSDGTMRFATDWGSKGEVLTLKYILENSKPKFDVDPRNPPTFQEARDWIKQNNIQVLNVAGNSQQTSPGIAKFVIAYLTEVLGGAE